MDLKALRKLESLPASVQARPRSDGEVVLVLIKLRVGFTLPSFVTPRAKMGDRMFSAQARVADLARLEADPAVESMSISRSIQVIE
ncbi:hypothetical protein GR215_33045 [Rhizobium leguminosarum]|uniref:hypothetical protein n=1 Tax=Rhizobium leguminosarum TaxID=384 RepID=UPI0013BA229A|nr:hypothetical protein [Rhizobium leguminosarum]NEH46629.1 hypothetical protein [Rhizobium leguminosarum]